MAVALTVAPVYPLPDKPVRVTVTASGGGNWAKVWLTAAPVGSDAKARLDASEAQRVQVFDGAAGDGWEFSDSVPGGYVFTAQEYTKNATTYGGGYSEDPDAFRTETKIGAETSSTVWLGSRLVATVGKPGDSATLVVHVWDGTVRPTTVAIHGEKTPALVAPSSGRARTAVENSTVTEAVQDLGDVVAGTLLTSLSSALENFRTQFNLHAASGTYHSLADSDNAIGKVVINTETAAGVVAGCNEVAVKLYRHMTNDDGAGGGPGATEYHTEPDWLNAAGTTQAGDIAGAANVLAAAWRAYEAHRIDTTAHSSADTTNALAALAPLLDIHAAFDGVVSAVSPTAAPTQNPGAVLLIHGAGFRED